jgi:hypothetical protein
MAMNYLSDDHLRAFGQYITSYAHLEHTLHFVIAGLMGKDVPSVGILTSDMSSRQKFDAALAFVSYHGGDPDGPNAYRRLIKLERLLEHAKTYSSLRNHIAHSYWKKGRKPGEIKPMSSSARGQIKVLGQDHNEKNYTAEEISQKADEIMETAQKIIDELEALGIFPHGENADN